MKKRMVSLLLALAMVMGLAAPAWAVEETTETDVLCIEGQYVQVDKNLSQEYRDRLIKLMKETNFVPEGIVCDIQYAQGWETNEDDGVAPCMLGPDEFYIEIVSQKLTVAGYDAFKLSAVGVWEDPNFLLNLDDVLALSWSGGFSLYKDSARAFYKNEYGVSKEFTDQAICSDVTPSAGIAYAVPTRVDIPYIYQLWYIQVDAWIRTPNTTGSANAVAQYAHKTFGPSITVNFSSAGPTISFGGSAEISLSEATYCELVY